MRSLLAALGAGSLLAFAGTPALTVAGGPVAPAAMAQSANHGSSVKDPAHANVYVPPFGQQATTAGGSYADQVSSLSDEQLAAAYGTVIPSIPATAVTTVASDDDTNGWRIAAIAGGGLLAAFALGAAVALRRRAARTGV
jgi:hypothetical protein